MTIDEVALELRVASRTVERWIALGYLRSFLLGGSRRIDRKDLVAFIRKAKAASDRRAARNRSERRKKKVRKRAARVYARGPRLPD